MNNTYRYKMMKCGVPPLLVSWEDRFKTMLLERKLEAEHETLEQREAALTEILQRTNLDSSLLGRVRTNKKKIKNRYMYIPNW